MSVRCFLRLAGFVVLFATCLPHGALWAQQVLKNALTGEVQGWHFSLHRGAPRIVILPEANDDRDERIALARSLLKLRANIYIPAMPEAFYNIHTPVDSLTKLTKRAIDGIFTWDRPSELLLIGAGRYASVALLSSLCDFRIKCLVALAPGEFFENNYSVTDSLSRLSVPVLALCRQEEQEMVRNVFKQAKRKLVVLSPTLRKSGYEALTDLGKRSGEAWLAVSLFYSEQFGE